MSSVNQKRVQINEKKIYIDTIVPDNVCKHLDIMNSCNYKFSNHNIMRRQSLNVQATGNINKMDVSVESLSHKKIKKKFMTWATKWYHTDIVEKNSEKPDITLLICLLQSLGFQLRKFEKTDDDNIRLEDNNNTSVKINIECSVSKMNAILELEDVKCQCSKSQDVDDASFWSVSGTAPTGSPDVKNKYEEIGSNLLPRLSKDTHNVIHDIIHGLLGILKTNNMTQSMSDSTSISTSEKIGKNYLDIYKSRDAPESLSRCYTQPEMPFTPRKNDQSRSTNYLNGPDNFNRHFSSIDIPSSLDYHDVSKITTPPAAAASETGKKRLIRQQTWDKETKTESEPRSSPPQIKLSPVIFTELCTSLDRVSLQSDDSSLTLMECLKRAQFYIEKAQNLQANKSANPSTPSGSLSANRKTSKSNDSINKSIRPKPPRMSLSLRPVVPPSSSSVKVNEKTIRRSATGIPSRTSSEAPKSTATERGLMTPSTNPLIRRQTFGESSQTFKLAVAGAQNKISAAKIASSSSSASSASNNSGSRNSVLSLSNQSRAITSTKRRVSEMAGSSGISKGNINRMKFSDVSKTPLSIGSSIVSMMTPKLASSSKLKLSGNNLSSRKSTNTPKIEKY